MFEAPSIDFGLAAHIASTGEELQVVPAREFRYEALVCVRLFAAKLVIEVRNEQHQAKFISQFQQHSQQRHRIGSAGHGNSNAVARLQQLAFTDVVENLLAHKKMVKPSAISRQLSAKAFNHGSKRMNTDSALRFKDLSSYPCNPC
jgi:hypothetical protein